MRGLHDPNKRMVIKSIVRKHKPDLVCFQETNERDVIGLLEAWGLVGTWVGCL